MTRIPYAVGLLLLAAMPAADARPRDEVMAGVFHCNGLGDDRQWLDCYYGAAQPARTSLGLKPAPANQMQLVQSPPANSQAQPSALRNRVIADAGRCYDQENDRGWLDCYYRAALPMREKLGLSISAGQSAARPASDNFGLRRQVEVASTQNVPDNITSRMASYSFDAQNVFTVKLENGESWRQLDGDGIAVRWTKPPGTYVLTIRSGMSHSFIMTVRDEPQVFRVHRIN